MCQEHGFFKFIWASFKTFKKNQLFHFASFREEIRICDQR